MLCYVQTAAPGNVDYLLTQVVFAAAKLDC